jgi:hypothetical protein
LALRATRRNASVVAISPAATTAGSRVRRTKVTVVVDILDQLVRDVAIELGPVAPDRLGDYPPFSAQHRHDPSGRYRGHYVTITRGPPSPNVYNLGCVGAAMTAHVECVSQAVVKRKPRRESGGSRRPHRACGARLRSVQEAAGCLDEHHVQRGAVNTVDPLQRGNDSLLNVVVAHAAVVP